ncbi:hypothetical protein MGG_17227 [Pyricularia oryzae 70-15]|uniref:Hydrophobin n=3 Tax=Pyricularia oryzae TaxID=318829 RepID=G4N903_PYRO7|nr:uncharacterized protein MGG_17227 [Pyricularia oryzae 70-15]EHA51098.1 hypothetical protein MGG_17227 [Pyricularia oryzae 70-15]ELQ43927.1 hypothetical protein OOU_Y34scaffold00124g1 [Pyricularia oryzae Y34]KAI7909172.1 hypothetical protein M9X92_011784 [Pyricularia oryzae]KAI7911905.1 hypothetical protein M0657_010706 [Pyricularia oryzae]
MRYSILILAPTIVLGQIFSSAGEPATGPLCCNRGVVDTSGTCKSLNLNAYACESIRSNSAKAVAGDPDSKSGCDNGVFELFPVGRDVKAFVPNSGDTIKLGPSSLGDAFTAFIGCAD